MERSDIVYLRTKYLRTVLHEIPSFENIVWIDETWANTNHTVTKGWIDDSLSSIPKVPLGKGGRLIILHAGNSHGFIPGARLVFKSKKSGDYHDEMNPQHFIEWFENNLLNNLNSNSVIVMDNAPYHSKKMDKVPTKSSTKKDILSWLVSQKLVAEESDLRKCELEKILEMNKPRFPPRYEIDELARSRGHRIVRLPPYHCEFNPIELIWENVKGYIARNNTHFNMTDLERLTHEAIGQVTAEDWRKAVQHCLKVSQDSWTKNGVVEAAVEQLKIVVTGDTSSESESDWDEEIEALED